MFYVDDIKFRSKFTRKVKFSTIEEVVEFKKLFVEILNKSEDFVIGLLWTLTYDSSGGVSPEYYQRYILRISDFTLDSQDLVLRELRYQYAKQNPNFLDVEERNWPSYQKLIRSSSEITAFIVLQKCKNLRMCSPDFIQREISILSLNFESIDDSTTKDEEDSPSKEEKVLTALKHLNFNTKAAAFLMPYAKEIAALLKAVTSSSDDTAVRTSHVYENKPQFLKKEENQPAVHEPTNAVQSAKQETQIEEDHQAKETLITPDVVLNNKDVMKHFFLSLQRLELIGIDPNMILICPVAVENFLTTLNKLNSLGLSTESILGKRSEIQQLLNALKLFDT